MAVTATPYGQAVLGLGLGYFDFSADTFKVALATASYTPSVDVDEFFSDIADEVVGTGYTAGGQALTGLVWAYTTSAKLAVDSPLWATATFTARYAVIYKDTGTPSTSRLLSYVNFGTDRSPSGIDFEINFGDGLLVAERTAP